MYASFKHSCCCQQEWQIENRQGFKSYKLTKNLKNHFFNLSLHEKLHPYKNTILQTDLQRLCYIYSLGMGARNVVKMCKPFYGTKHLAFARIMNIMCSLL